MRSHLESFCKEHDYTKRFETGLQRRVRSTKPGYKKKMRNLALKLVRFLDGKSKMRRADVTQAMQAQSYTESEIHDMLKKLHDEGLLRVTRGRYADVSLA